MNDIHFEVLKSFLCDSMSHRWIQKNILGLPAPAKGGGFKTMSILHSYDIKGERKGCLSEYSVNKNNILGLVSEFVARNSEIDQNYNYTEGSVTIKKVNSYERNSSARKKCIEHYGDKCFVCAFDFSENYGSYGAGFIEVHHKIPLSTIDGEYKVNPINDLIPLCSNCHSMIHRRKKSLTIKKLKNIYKNSKLK